MVIVKVIVEVLVVVIVIAIVIVRSSWSRSSWSSCPLGVHQVPRLPRKSSGDQGWDARAYIRPIDSAPSATPATQKWRRPRDTGGTPGRTSDPLGVHQVPRLPCKSGGDQGTPEGRQGVHPTPWECTKCRACHAKAAETKVVLCVVCE